MGIDLPEDAAGREIPLDTEVLYTEDVDPVDAAHCTGCGPVPGAVHHGHDGTYTASRTEFETTPRYRTRCGEDLANV